MTVTVSRRRLLSTVVAATAAGSGWPPVRPAQAAGILRLNVTRRVIEVNGKAASVFGLVQPDGTSGLFLDPGQRFLVDLVNQLGEETIVHWHGQTPPANQDGVALTGLEKLIAAGATRHYDFAPRTGTHWMHSHQGLQEMQLMSAPLVVRSAEDLRMDAQEVTVILHDFTFRSPDEVLASLNGGGMAGMAGMAASGAMPAAPGGSAMAGMAMAGHAMRGMAADSKPMQATAAPMQMGGDAAGPDLNDFDFDAYLANDRSLADPQVVRTERGGRVRLRVINAAASTVFWLDLGTADGTVIAVDGMPVKPVTGRRFPMSEAQRLDILVRVEPGEVVPILAQRVGDRARTGIILAAPDAVVAKLSDQAAQPAGPSDTSLEERLTAIEPLSRRPVDLRLRLVLGGSMSPYGWRLNGRGWDDRKPLQVEKGQRVVLDIANETTMAHPMHLHGHSFQVVALNGKRFDGAMRDVMQVPAKGSASVAFDADNPGRWLIHCHNMLHMETGMITELVYKS
jgi:FtsP/CotA-like multicopper oxidase with cupredoxin domain